MPHILFLSRNRSTGVEHAEDGFVKAYCRLQDSLMDAFVEIKVQLPDLELKDVRGGVYRSDQGIPSDVNESLRKAIGIRIGPGLLKIMKGLVTFVIKAHAAPTPFALNLIRRGQIRPTYIYRDPRDAMLSAMENGQRALQRNRPNSFSGLVEFESALSFMLAQVEICQAWMSCPQALHARYEDLLTVYETEAERLVAFLQLDKAAPELTRVIEQYRPEKAQPDQKGVHFSQGKIGRFRKKMSEAQQETLAGAFGPYLGAMGYPI